VVEQLQPPRGPTFDSSYGGLTPLAFFQVKFGDEEDEASVSRCFGGRSEAMMGGAPPILSRLIDGLSDWDRQTLWIRFAAAVPSSLEDSASRNPSSCSWPAEGRWGWSRGLHTPLDGTWPSHNAW